MNESDKYVDCCPKCLILPDSEERPYGGCANKNCVCHQKTQTGKRQESSSGSSLDSSSYYSWSYGSLRLAYESRYIGRGPYQLAKRTIYEPKNDSNRLLGTWHTLWPRRDRRCLVCLQKRSHTDSMASIYQEQRASGDGMSIEINNRMKKNPVAVHKKTKTEYVYAEICGPRGELVSVSTARGWPQTWLVDRRSVEILNPEE